MSAPVVIASLRKNQRENFRVALDTWQDVRLIDLRVTTEIAQASGIQTPTKKGVSLRVEMLPEIITALRDAERQARELGWLGGAA